MSIRYLRWTLAACLCAISLFQAGADVRIILKDGRVINVPIAPEEVQSIELQTGRTGSQQGLPPSPTMNNAPPAPTFRPGSPVTSDVTTPAPPPKSGSTFVVAPPPPPAPTAASVPAAASGSGRIQVGPNRAIKLPSQAAGVAKPGDVIEIDAGSYRGDTASWRTDNITIRGVGGRARLVADGNSAEGKAIWVIKGRDVTVENIEFAEAQVPDGNGAGIRAEGTNLKIINCYFHDNQEGILVSNDTPDSVIDIENSEFARDGGNEGRSHEIYISPIKELIVRGSYFHDGQVGHLIKTRARTSIIIANRVTDEGGHASYEIDASNGGRVFVIGNLFEKNPRAENSITVANAMEGPTLPEQEFYVINNTFLNDLGHGVFIYSRAPTPAKIVNNLFIGGGSVFHGTGELKNNLLSAGPGGAPNIEQELYKSGDLKEEGTKTTSDPGLVDLAHYDWHLTPKSPAIGAGIDPGSAGGMSLLPTLEYVHPAHAQPVKVKPPIDIGAYQHGG